MARDGARGRIAPVIRAHKSGIVQLIRHHVIFGPFRHNIAENGPQDLKMV
jgi:hypothetical protein